MKTKLFTFITSSLLVVLPMKATSPFESLQVEDKIDIDLQGDIEDDNKKSLALPFKAYQVDNAEICIMASETFSSVTIRVIDKCGTTINVQSLSLSPQEVISFDISSYPNGIYTLAITTPQGSCLTGAFEIN